MKKIFLLLGIFVFLFNFAQTANAEPQGVTFLYINGSNNNDKKMKDWYYAGIYDLHPEIIKQLKANEEAFQYFTEEGKYKINEKPHIFFWGDKSKEDLDFLTQNLAITKGLSPWAAYQVRYLFATCLHDAIWVQKYHNMQGVLKELHKHVLQEYNKGNKVVLYGYSAGTFVTYQYLFNKLTYINLSEFANALKLPDNVKQHIKDNPRKDTCIDALIESNISTLAMNGHMVPNQNTQARTEAYMNLDKVTDKVCIPQGAVRGIVNYANPLVLFYSDLADPNYDMTFYIRYLYKYLIENDMFWLTVNYREDPLGFPNSKNLTNDEVEIILNEKINSRKGFIFDDSHVKSGKTFITAHTSYWSKRKRFAKAIAKAYATGYKFQYDPEFQTKVLKKRSNKFEIK